MIFWGELFRPKRSINIEYVEDSKNQTNTAIFPKEMPHHIVYSGENVRCFVFGKQSFTSLPSSCARARGKTSSVRRKQALWARYKWPPEPRHSNKQLIEFFFTFFCTFFYQPRTKILTLLTQNISLYKEGTWPLIIPSNLGEYSDHFGGVCCELFKMLM